MRVMTWNLWWRFGGNWREREVGIISRLEEVQPDVVGLQEVWVEKERLKRRYSPGTSACTTRSERHPCPRPPTRPHRQIKRTSK
jgi:endonuclease/exonuclease/phosphatase family metal-dependent hydrolase